MNVGSAESGSILAPMTPQSILEARVALLERQIAQLLPIIVSLIAANKTLIEMLTLADASQETAH